MPERAPTAAAAAGGGVGTLVANIFIMALAWAVAWALADFVSQIGIFGLENLSYDLEIMRQNAAGGVIGGALAGFSLSLLFFGATVWGWLRIGVTIVFWVLSELFLVRNWDSLGIETIEGFLVIIGLFGLLYGLIFALLLVGQKPGWGNVVRVPVAAIALMLAAVLGRYLQYGALG
ncbi:hypothetical protein [Sinisalibacter lacisalsi]|uniref:Uncharacterized protein n=1 Tax=Sinisalibacter lacisalsi TaxID=1526570 RepID=A0ABQ1QG67_9RHOB|nr:hypothetical protein [Sinisalibacter lacisalsi]GGD24806.1 hypothetical protein GCM10011358_06570 [Sinisalibacter lacisalsi]